MWWDQNQDGLQTTGEPGLGAVKVQLYREFWQSDGFWLDLLETKVTGSNGSYEFTGLLDGKYYVEFTPPNGWHHGWGLTSSLVGADRQIDSDGWWVSVDIVDGSSHNDIDAGFVRTSAIEPPTGNLKLTNHNFAVVAEADEEDAAKTKLPACGCEATLSVNGLNQTASNGTLTLTYPTDVIEIRDMSGEVIPSGYVIGDTSFVVIGLAQGVATITLDYSGPAGNQWLDRISLTVPNPHFDIDLRVAAYIPLSKGRGVDWRTIPLQPDKQGAIDVNWMKEPGSVPNPGVFYGTNDRELPGEAGTSKIAVNGIVNTLDIGNFEGLGTIFTAEESKTYRAIVHKENPGDVHWIDGRTVEYEIQTPATVETRSDVNSERSSVRIVATAGYPFTPAAVTPNIDFDIAFTLQVLSDCSVEVSYNGWRDNFPAYEIMVEGNVIHSFLAPGEIGPNPLNLNTWTYISGSIVVAPGN